MDGEAGDELGDDRQPNDGEHEPNARADQINDEIHDFTPLRGRPRLGGAGESASSTGTMGGTVETGPSRLHCSLKK